MTPNELTALLAEIEDAAKAAQTPYAWSSALFQSDDAEEWKVVGGEDDEWVCDCGIGGNAEPTAKYLARISPSTALSLVHEVRVLQAKIIELESK